MVKHSLRGMVKQALLTGIIGLAGFSTAQAAPFYFEFGFGEIDNGEVIGDLSGNDSTRTGDYNALGTTNTLATSIYDAADADSIRQGTTVFDTNRTDLLNEYNVTGLGLPEDNQRNVAVLDPSESIAQDNNFASGPGNWEEGGDFWGLTFDYDFTGTVISGTGADLDNAVVSFTEGTVDYFFEYDGNSLQVLSVDVTGSGGSIANLVLQGWVNFDFLTSGSFSTEEQTFIQSFFRDSDSGESFYDLVTAGNGIGIPISWRLDTNVDTGGDPVLALTAGSDGDDNDVMVRQTQLNTSARFAPTPVPEPSVLILMGLGLFALGFVAHRRRPANHRSSQVA